MRSHWLLCLIGLLTVAGCQRGESEQVQISCLHGSPGHRICSEYSGFDNDAISRMAANCRSEYGRVVHHCDVSQHWVGSCLSSDQRVETRRWRHHHLVHPDRASEYPLVTLMRSCQSSQGTWQAPTQN